MTTASAPRPVLLVSGSVRRESLSRIVLKLTEALARKKGLHTQFVCAREMALPLFGLPDEDSPRVLQWRQAVQQAAGVILCSPEYHGAFSGAFKNMIDHLVPAQVEGKPAALIAVGGGSRAGLGTLNGMRLMLNALRVPVIVEQAAAWEGDFLPDTRSPRPELLQQLGRLVDGLTRELGRR